jgi:hypothetical protein
MPAAGLLVLLLCVPGASAPPAVRLHVPALSQDPGERLEARWLPDAPVHPVPTDLRLVATVVEDIPPPPTDPGHTSLRVALRFPLLARDGRTVLLPAGTRLQGRVNVLRGEYLFTVFQSIALPDGRGLALPDAAFALSPASDLELREGSTLLITVHPGLRMEPWGTLR